MRSTMFAPDTAGSLPLEGGGGEGVPENAVSGLPPPCPYSKGEGRRGAALTGGMHRSLRKGIETASARRGALRGVRRFGTQRASRGTPPQILRP